MITKDHFKELKKNTVGPCISLYISTEIAGDYEKNRIRWKNACQKAESQLKEKFPEASDKILRPAWKLVDDQDFWANQSTALAGFYSQDRAQYFHMVSSKSEIVSVHDSFYLAPLFREVADDNKVYIMSISKNSTGLYEAVKDGIFPMKIHDAVVEDTEDALFDHQVGPQRKGGGSFYYSNMPANYNTDHQLLVKYFRKLDEGFLHIVCDDEIPLVLACVEEYYHVYKSITKYGNFADFVLTGNPDHKKPAELREAIQPYFDKLRREKIESFHSLYQEKLSQKLSTDHINDIHDAANAHNLQSLLVNQVYLDSVNQEERERIDDLMVKAFENGTKVMLSTDEESDKAIMAIRRFEMKHAS